MLQNSYITFQSQLGIISPKIQGLYFALQALLVVFLPILCSLHNSIMNLISLFGSRSTFGALWERNIPLEIGHIRDIETNVSNVIFALFSWFFKIWTRSSHKMWKTRLQTLCIVFESQSGIFIPKIENLCFASQTTHLRSSTTICIFSNVTMNIVSIFHQYMHIFQCDNKYSLLI